MQNQNTKNQRLRFGVAWPSTSMNAFLSQMLVRAPRPPIEFQAVQRLLRH